MRTDIVYKTMNLINGIKWIMADQKRDLLCVVKQQFTSAAELDITESVEHALTSYFNFQNKVGIK